MVLVLCYYGFPVFMGDTLQLLQNIVLISLLMFALVTSALKLRKGQKNTAGNVLCGSTLIRASPETVIEELFSGKEIDKYDIFVSKKTPFYEKDQYAASKVTFKLPASLPYASVLGTRNCNLKVRS